MVAANSTAQSLRTRDRAPEFAHQGRSPSLRFDERVSAIATRLRSIGDERQAALLRTHVTEARAFVRGWDAKSVSQATAARYESRVKFLREMGRTPLDAACKNSFSFDRAAWVHVHRAETKEALRGLDRHRRAGNINQAAEAYIKIQKGLGALRRLPPGTGDREADLMRVSAYQGLKTPERSNGKAPSAALLPPDWRERLQAELPVFDRAPGAVMSITGCRPSELQGARVRTDGKKIFIVIKGAKTDDVRGVSQRTLSYDRAELATTPHGRDILQFLGEREQRTIAIQGSADAFRQRYARAAERAGLVDAAAYTARHASARELRAEGTSQAEIAQRLGHRRERSQRVYGK